MLAIGGSSIGGGSNSGAIVVASTGAVAESGARVVGTVQVESNRNPCRKRLGSALEAEMG
jgi:hypothetical protein